MKPIAMTDPRYAIYFVPDPDTALYRFGAAALGYDCFTGADIPTLDAPPVHAGMWRELTREPRRYGFHATLKAPFCLAAGRTEAELIGAFVEWPSSIVSAPAIEPTVSLLQRFVAIVPAAACARLDRLAASCVKHFDKFRAPLTSADRGRRFAAALTTRQIEQVERWGYPHVFEDFRFHMTLTGPLPEAARDHLIAVLRRAFDHMCGKDEIAVDRLALVKQPEQRARFRVVCQAELSR